MRLIDEIFLLTAHSPVVMKPPDQSPEGDSEGYWDTAVNLNSYEDR